MILDTDKLISELEFKAIRSSGAGGQHVNKVASKVELQFDVNASEGLTDDEKGMLKTNLSSKLTNDHRLILQCGDTRSQHKNKALIIQRFLELIDASLREEKERIPTKTPKSAKKKRLKKKRQHAEKKARRQPPEVD